MASRRTYGSPRLCDALRGKGDRCGKNRIARLMRQSGLRAQAKATLSVPTPPTATMIFQWRENWLAKVPTPDRPGQVWQSDITYIHHPRLALSRRHAGRLLAMRRLHHARRPRRSGHHGL